MTNFELTQKFFNLRLANEEVEITVAGSQDYKEEKGRESKARKITRPSSLLHCHITHLPHTFTFHVTIQTNNIINHQNIT